MQEDKVEKYVSLFLTIFLIFIIGIQIGIHHGRELQRQDDVQELYDYISSN